MNSEFLPEADEEFREAVRYYENEAPGVGLRFVAEVRRGVTFITENPYAAAGVGSGIRRKVLNHFPYSLLYAVESELIVIVAVAHHKSRPRYWRGRVKVLRERVGRPSGVARDYSDVKTDMALVDEATMWFVKNPEYFDVVVASNLFGDIITDLGAMLQGGMGFAAGGERSAW